MPDNSLAGLAARVAQLEETADVQPSYAPLTGLKVQPDGSIQYDFEGHLRAEGLALGTTAQPGNAVDWERDDAGSLAAQALGLYTAEQGGELRVSTYPKDGGVQIPGDDPPAPGSRLLMLGGGDDQRAGVSVIAGAEQRLVLDDLARSDFVQSRGVLWRNFTGPWDGFAEEVITVPAPGSYLVVYQGTGYRPVPATKSGLDLYVDGVLKASSTLYFNQANVHLTIPLHGVVVFLTAGDTIFELRDGAPGGNTLSSDANDVGFLFAIPITP